MDTHTASSHPMSLDRGRTALLVVDVQERLFPAMDADHREEVVRNIKILATSARRLRLPVVATEQYPKGLGHTLLEEMVYDGGQLLNGSLLDYRIPRAHDAPLRLRCRFVENADGPGPFGAKGAGEGSLVPVSPAVGNALARLTGIRFRDLPLTPERVWRALRQHDPRRTP